MKGILLDLDGVVYVGHKPLPGSLEAIRLLRDAGVPLRFITNTTRRPRQRIVADLAKLGLEIEARDLFTPAAMAREVLTRLSLTPFLVVHPDLQEEFSGLDSGNAEAVVIGDAGSFFTYDLLNQAYRKILHGAEFLALAKNRNFLDHDHELSLDAGPFVTALEYASGRTATVLGKPSPTFFALAVESMGCAPEDVVMIGDDAEADIGGAMAAGLQGILVQTGKYRPGQEATLPQRPTHVVPNLWAAVTFLYEEQMTAGPVPPCGKPRWEHFPHDADIGIRGFAATVAEAFAQAALALTATVTDAPIAPLVRVEVQCEAPDLELLLVAWLDSIIYEMAVRQMVFGEYAVRIDGLRLDGTLSGEPVDVARHAPACEPKGATYTELAVTRAADGQWSAACVIDV